MHKVYLLLFAIPVVSIVVIGLYQILDETFKKEFILERRGAGSADAAPGELKRRYLDSVADEANSTAETEKDAPVAQVS